MYSGSSSDQYNQNVSINFQGEDTLSKVVDSISDKVGNLQFKITGAKLGVDLWNKSINNSSKELVNLSANLVKTDAILQKVWTAAGLAKIGTTIAKGISDANLALQGFNDGLKLMNASGFNTGILDSFLQLGKTITFDTQALNDFTLNAVTAFNKFNEAKTQVATLFGNNDDFVKNLSANIQKLVNNDLKNAITSIDALGASYQAASAGFTDASDNQNVMVAGLKLAKAGAADTGTVMKVLTQTIRAYGLQSTDANKVAAALNKTVQLGITTMPELANGFAQVAVVAKTAGIKLEDLSGAVAALTLQGASTPSAFTGLESLSRNIINKTPQATEALRQLRDEAGKPIKFDIAEIKAKGLAKALDDLNKAAKGNAQVLAEIIPESNAYSTALSLMANNAKQLKDNSAAIYEVTKTGTLARKALDEVFGIKINTQAEKFDEIVNRITEQFIQFGEQLAPFFNTGIAAIENFTKFLSGISPETKQLIAQFLIAQLTLGKFKDVLDIALGTVVKVTAGFLAWRGTILLMNGELGRELGIIRDLIKAKAGLIPVLKQLFGFDQSRLILEKGINQSSLTRTQILEKLKEQNAGIIPYVKQWIGIDQSHLVTLEQTNLSYQQREDILNNIVQKNALYQKEINKVKQAEQELDILENRRIQTLERVGESLNNIHNIENNLKDSSLKIQADPTNFAEIEKYNNQKVEHEKATTQYQVLRKKLDDDEIASNQAKTKVITEATKAEELANKIKQNTIAITDANIAATQLQKKATEAKVLADIAEDQALIANNLAKEANFTNTALNTAATDASTRAKLLSKEAQIAQSASEQANTTVKKLQTTATMERLVAEGKLVEVQTFAGKAYLANIPILKSLYLDTGKQSILVDLLSKSYMNLKNSMQSLIGIGNNIFQGISGYIATLLNGNGNIFQAALNNLLNLGTFTLNIFKKGFTGLTTLITTLGTKAWLAIAPLLPTLIALTPLIIAASAAGAILYDQFFGTTSQVNKLNKVLEDNNKELNTSLIKLLEQRKIQSGLTYSGTVQLENLKLQKIETEQVNSVWDEIVNNVGGFFSNLSKSFNVISNFIPFAKELKDIFKGIGNIYGEWRLNQLQPILNKINSSIEQTENKTIDLIKRNKSLINGSTYDNEIDKLMMEGKSLNIKQQTQINKVFEENKLYTEQLIKSNEKAIEDLNKQLEDYDKKSPNEKDKAGEADKKLAADRDVFVTQNEQLKKQMSAYAENQKTFVNDFVKNREILIKRIQDNTQESLEGKNNQGQDFKGVNYIEGSLKRSLARSKKDLEVYSSQVVGLTYRTGKYIEDGITKDINIAGDNINVDITDMTNKLDSKVKTTIDTIDDLYKNNYINAGKAKDEILGILDSTVKTVGNISKKQYELLDIKDYISYVGQVIEYSQKEGERIKAILEDNVNLNKALQEAGLKSAKDNSKELRKIQTADIENQINTQETTLKLLKQREQITSPEEIEKQERKLNILKTQLKAQNLNNTKDEIEERTKEQERGYNKELAALKFNKSSFLITEEKYQYDLDMINRKQITNKQIQLTKELSLVGVDKEKKLEIQTQLLSLQQQYEEINTGMYERELNKRSKLIQNNTTQQVQDYQKVINIITVADNSLNNQIKILESRTKLQNSFFENDNAKLQNQLRITADIQTRADIEYKIAENKNKQLVIQQKYELDSFSLQQKVLLLSLQRQEVELNIKKLENETSKKLIELEIERAKKQQVRSEDLKALELRLNANEEEGKVLNKQGELLKTNNAIQKEISANSLAELKNKQDIAKQGGTLDLELAKRNNILAGYEKQARIAQTEALIVETTTNKQLTQQDLINKAYQLRVDLANKQLQIQESNTNQQQRLFSLAQGLTSNENLKNRLQENAAIQQLKSLNSKHDLEQKVLEIQIKQNKLTLERAKLEQAVAKTKLDAEVKVQEAETKKTLADPTKTDEEKQAAIAQLDAKKFQRDSQYYQDYFIKQQEKQQATEEKLQRDNLNTKQGNETQDAVLNYAKSSPLQGRNNKILNAILKNLPTARSNENILDNYNLNNLFAPKQTNVEFPELDEIPTFGEFIKTINKQNNIELPNGLKLNELKLGSLNNKPINIDQTNPLLVEVKSIRAILEQSTGIKTKDIIDTNKKDSGTKKQNTINGVTINNNISINADNNSSNLDYAKELEKVTIDTMYNVIRRINTENKNT